MYQRRRSDQQCQILFRVKEGEDQERIVGFSNMEVISLGKSTFSRAVKQKSNWFASRQKRRKKN